MVFPTLRTPRLLMRPFTAEDLDELVRLDADPEVMRYLTGGRPTPRDEVEGHVLPATLREYEEFPGLGRWAAIEEQTGEFVGWIRLRPRPTDTGRITEAELGYRLRRSSWGRGYAREGSRAALDHGFTAVGLDRVWAETMAINSASRRVMEVAGLRYVRTFFVDWDDPIEGSEHGEVEYEVLRAEWLSRSESQSAR